MKVDLIQLTRKRKTKNQIMNKIHSSSHDATNNKVFELIKNHGITGGKILDVGAGFGHMVQRIGEFIKDAGLEPKNLLRACDIFPEKFQYEEIKCEKFKFIDRLPYEDDTFNIVYSIEVIEHLYKPYDLVAEMHRILRPGGTAIITTPNILNLNSRVTFLANGFYSLFDPVSFDENDIGGTGGHISPISYYYLDYFFKKTGFKNVEMFHDKIKRSAMFYFFLLYPLLRLSNYYLTSKTKRLNLYEVNKSALDKMASKQIIGSRTCIMRGTK